MLQIRRQHDSLVAGFSGKLDAQVPGIEGDEYEVEVLGCKVLGGKRIEPADGVSEGTGISDMLPSEGRQARCKGVVVSSSFRSTGCLPAGLVDGAPRWRPINMSSATKRAKTGGKIAAWEQLTAQGSDRSVDRLDEDALVGDLWEHGSATGHGGEKSKLSMGTTGNSPPRANLRRAESIQAQ